MTFLEGAFLAGLLAMAIPIAIHLLHRARSRKLLFPTLRFLKEARARTARRSRILEWLVLALRLAAVSLLALALARPVLRGAAGGRGGAAVRVLVVDNSMSMDARDEGWSALDRSVAAAREIVQTLHAGDRAAVLPLHAREGAEAAPPPALTESRADLERSLAAIRPTHRDSPVLPAIEQAAALLAAESHPTRQICVFTDMQATAFPPDARPVKVPEGASLILLRPTCDPAPNVRVDSARPVEDSGLGGPPGGSAADGRSAGPSIRATLLSLGGESLARLRLAVDGKAVEERSVRVPADGDASVLLVSPGLAPGLHRAEVRADGDVLPADDAIEVPLITRGPLVVLVVRDPAAGPGGRDPALFVAKALLAGSRRGAGLRVRVIATGDIPADLTVPDDAPPTGMLPGGAGGRDDSASEGGSPQGPAAAGRAGTSAAHVVFLLDPSRLEPAAASALAAFVLRGGGLFISAGPALGTETLESLSCSGRTVSPARIAGLLRAEGDPLRLTAWDEDHPLWAPLVGSGPPLRPDAARFLAAKNLVPAEDAVQLAAFQDGHPAILYRSAGEGKVLLFASSFSDDWGNLPLRHIFAPLVHSIVRSLAPGAPAVETLLAGTRLVIRHPEGSGFRGAELELPDGSSRRVQAARAAAADPALEADLGVLERPGIHAILERMDGNERRRIITVVSPPRESDLRPVDEARRQQVLPGSRISSFRQPGEAAAAVLSGSSGPELRTPLLLALLAVLLVEPLLANRAALRRARHEAAAKPDSGAAPGGAESPKRRKP